MITASEMHLLAESNSEAKVKQGFEMICHSIKLQAENGEYFLKVGIEEGLTWKTLNYAKDKLIEKGFDCKLVQSAPMYERPAYLSISW